MTNPTIQQSQKKTIRINAACDVYGLSRTTIYRMIESGKISPVKAGGCVFLSVAELDAIFLGATA